MNHPSKHTLDDIAGTYIHLEPRVAKLETSIDTLTQDVRDLATIVRSQGEQVEDQIKNLLVAVTAAAGPRKTDWGVLVSSIGLFLAIGAAALSPLYMKNADIALNLMKIEERFNSHQQLTLHPVGARVVTELADEIATLEGKIKSERLLTDKFVDERLDNLDEHVKKLEAARDKDKDADISELRVRRYSERNNKSWKK